jgi:glycerophosphoryl diester phosphodiesterase
MPAWGRRTAGARPLVIGHRGASARAPENSVEAFARARTDGADGVELDVLCCRGGEVVVFHDDDLRRLGGRPERIDALELAELRRVVLRGDARVPTLEEAFEACGPDMLVNVELKAPFLGDGRLRALVEGTAAVLARTGVASRVLVSSFNPRAVRLWTRRQPAVPAALLFERAEITPLRRAWAAQWLRPAALNPELVLCTPVRVARWHALGYAVNTWTVDGEAAVRAAREAHVDGIITNDPVRTLELLAAR